MSWFYLLNDVKTIKLQTDLLYTKCLFDLCALGLIFIGGMLYLNTEKPNYYRNSNLVKEVQTDFIVKRDISTQTDTLGIGSFMLIDED